MSNIRLTPEEIERRTRLWLQWSGQFGDDLMKLHTYGFRGYLIKDNQVVETIIDPVYQKQIDSIHEYMTGKAKELGLI